jgi:hypothetical protein
MTKFLDPNTKQETERRIPKARILDYRIIITTAPFSFNTNVCPIAIVQTDSNGNVVAITDARQLMFRLAPGGDTPNADGSYTWTDTNRRENSITYDSVNSPLDPFSEGDKDIFSMKDWMNAVMSVVWEAKSGESWYSPTSRDMIKLLYTNPAFTEGDNFIWDSAASKLYFRNLKVLFENSSGGWYNNIADPQVSVSSISRSGTTVTVNTGAAHTLLVGGQLYLISSDSNFPGGLKTVVSVPTSTQLTYTEAGSAVSGSGSFTLQYGASLAAGQCLYVDLDRKTTPSPTIVAAVGTLQNLPSPVIPGSRIIIAWRYGNEVHVRDRAYPLGRIALDQKYPNVILDPLGSGDAPNFTAAIALLPAYGGVILLANDISLASTVTIPANVKVIGRLGVTITLAASAELQLGNYCQLEDIRVTSARTSGVLVRATGTNVKINKCRFNCVTTPAGVVCLRVQGNYTSCNMSEFDGVLSPSGGIGVQVAGGVTAFNEYDNTYLV